ncbi:MAG: NDP-sugar synthase [Deltaproteobacteria bacterium]|nr:NDP-sugar synthase [Deltaproteobacteria bacterium]
MLRIAGVKAFVLAAGFGERLRPITESVPKPLLPVGNLPLIGYALKLCQKHGITDVIVNLHYLGKVIKERLGDGHEFGVTLTYSEEEEILGTGGGLKKMDAALAGETFVVLNSDTIIDLDLKAVIASHRKRRALATLVLRADARQGEFGQIEVDAGGRVRRILGHGEARGRLTPYMFAGVHVAEPRLLEYVPPDVNTCIMRYGYTKALDNGEPIYGVVADGYWNDAGTPERYLEANRDALSQKMKLKHADPLAGYAVGPKRAVADVVRMGTDVHLGDAVEIVAPVLMGDDCKVGDRAVVGPYCVLAARAQIGKEARVSSAVLLEGAKVEAGERLDRVIVGKKATLTAATPAPASERA